MKPAILQLIPSLDTGGAERSAIDMAETVAHEGFAALVVSEGGRMERELAEKGGELIRLPVASKSPLTILANARRLERLIRERDVKLVHARSRAPAWSGLIAAKRTGVPFIATYHGLYSARTALKRWYNSAMVKGEAVIANSAFTADHIAREYPHVRACIVTIPRGLDENVFDPAKISAARVAAMRTGWGADDGDTVILLPGRLTRWKGQLVLIEALEKLADTSHLTAVFAGDAQGRDAYAAELDAAVARAGLTDRVHIAGHVDDMAAAYLAADIVASASTEPEAFGRVAAEASAMGRPVIATDHGGARETVVAGQSGLLVPPGDAPALADALGKLIAAGPAERAAMGAIGQAHVLSRFTRAKMCADTLALYRKIIARI